MPCSKTIWPTSSHIYSFVSSTCCMKSTQIYPVFFFSLVSLLSPPFSTCVSGGIVYIPDILHSSMGHIHPRLCVCICLSLTATHVWAFSSSIPESVSHFGFLSLICVLSNLPLWDEASGKEAVVVIAVLHVGLMLGGDFFPSFALAALSRLYETVSFNVCAQFSVLCIVFEAAIFWFLAFSVYLCELSQITAIVYIISGEPASIYCTHCIRGHRHTWPVYITPCESYCFTPFL